MRVLERLEGINSMDISDISIESDANITSNQIFNLLYDFFDSVVSTRPRIIIDSFIKESEQLFEIIQSTVDSFPQLFFEFMSAINATLVEYALLKFVEISQFIPEPSIQSAIVKILLHLILICKIRSTKDYEKIMQTLSTLLAQVISSTNRENEKIQLTKIEIFSEEIDHIYRLNNVLVSLLTKLYRRDLKILYYYSHNLWEFICFVLNSGHTYKHILKLLIICLSSNAHITRLHVFRSARAFNGYLTVSGLEYDEKSLKYFSKLKQMKPSRRLNNFLIGTTEYFSRMYNFFNLKNIELELCIAIFNCALTYSSSYNHLMETFKNKILTSDLPLYLLKKYNLVKNPSKIFIDCCALIFDKELDPGNLLQILELLTLESYSKQVCVIKFLILSWESSFSSDQSNLLEKVENIISKLITHKFDYLETVCLIEILSFLPKNLNNTKFIVTSIEKFPVILTITEISEIIKDFDNKSKSIITDKIFSYSKSSDNLDAWKFLSLITEKENNTTIENAIVSITNIKLFIQVSIIFKNLLDCVVRKKVLELVLTELNDEEIELYLDILATFNVQENLNYIKSQIMLYLDQELVTMHTFRQQHRFITHISKMLLQFAEIIELRELLFVRFLECSFYFSHAFIPLMSEYILLFLKKLSLNLMDLYHINPSIFVDTFLKFLNFSDQTGLEEQLLHLMTSLSLLIDNKDSNTLISYIICECLKTGVMNGSSNMISAISKIKNCCSKQLLLNHIKYIIPHIFINANDKKNCIKFIETQLTVPISSVIRSEFQAIIHHCFLYLYDHTEAILTGLLEILDEIPFTKPYKYQSGCLSEFFRSRLLGILAFYNFSLISGDSTYKKYVIKSLEKLIECAGQQAVGRYRLKIVSLLIFATEISGKYNLSRHILAAWSTFIEMINEKYLGPLMPQIVLNCLPMVSKHEDDVYSVIYKTIIENSNKTHKYLSLLHIFCAKPSFRQISMIVSKFWANIYQQNIDLILETFKIGLGCDQIEIKRTAIINFSDYLINMGINSNAIINRCNKCTLLDIYNELLKCCNDVRSEILLEAGRCLGILGSLDYNYFVHSEIVPDETNKPHLIPIEYKKELDEFGVELLTCLANAFLSITETYYQDFSAFAIQEILMVYHISNFGLDDNPFLKRFPQMIQEVLIPHMTSSYSSKPVQTPNKFLENLFGSPQASTYSDWVRLWCSSLITYIPPDTFRSKLLTPCYAIVRYHVSTAKFLLPYVIVSLLDVKSTYIGSVSAEIKYVLNVDDTYQNINNDKALAITTIFDILDFIDNYQNLESSQILKDNYKQFLEKFCKSHLSKAAFVCKSYARALRNIEKYIIADPSPANCLVNNLPFLKKIYYCLNDFDGIIGASRFDSSCHPDSSDVNQLEIEGRFMEAISHYNKRIQQNSSEVALKYHEGIFKSYMNLGQFQSMISYFNNLEECDRENLISMKAEALWRLSKWDELDSIISSHPQSEKNQIDFHSATVVNNLVKNDSIKFKESLKSAYFNVAKSLSVSGYDAYTIKRCSPTISKLHMLFDIESYYRINHDLRLFEFSESIESVSKLFFPPAHTSEPTKFSEWSKVVRSRLDHTEYSFEIQEPILHMYRVLSSLSSKTESTSIWVSCVNLARKCGYFQTSFNYLLNVDDSSSHNFLYVYEMAKLLKKTRSDHEALNFLRKKVVNLTPVNEDQALIHSNLKLMMCKLMNTTSDCDPSDIIKYFNGMLTAAKNLEKVHFNVGMYLDKLVCSKTSEINSGVDYNNTEIQIVHHYGSSLRYGYRYIHQSLPRLVTLWLDYSLISEAPNALGPQHDKQKQKLTAAMTNEINKKIIEMCEKVSGIAKMLPPYVFYCVLPQLVSRICHQNSHIWNVLLSILTKLLCTFPHQVSWQLVGIAHSSFINRVKRCKMVFDAAAKENIEIGTISTRLLLFTPHLLDVCNHKEKLSQISLSHVFPSLKAFISQVKNKNIMVPLLSTLTCNIPQNVNVQNHSFFENPAPYIVEIVDRIDVLSSLIRPKKIVFVASNGRKYTMLCKPKDDLRRDSRLMEFNSLVNKLLNKNPKSRRRNLRIHLYSVVSINDECGILEWVEKTVSFRSVLMKLYSERGIGFPIEKIKELYTATHRDPDALLKLFTDIIIPAFPPVLYTYFYKKYHDAANWFSARQLFMRSTAVMSMVGYILGLGDRHGENILFSESGEIVHVDFNCLFNKGDTFEWPEKVPFRLTHNMVDAMGPLGIESCFRSSCEITMEIMRSRVDSLVGVLSTFLHDPLVEWVKTRKNTGVTGEQVNEKARKMLTDVEKRLLGIIPQSHFNVSLSIQGKVHDLIQESTSLRNLSQMYFGWGAYY